MLSQDTLQQEILGWRTLAHPIFTPTSFSKFVSQHQGTIRPGSPELLQLLRSFLSYQLRADDPSNDAWLWNCAMTSEGRLQLLDLFPYQDLLQGGCSTQDGLQGTQAGFLWHLILLLP